MTSPAVSQDVSENKGSTLAQRFSGITQGDYVRDVIAAILLLVSLSMATSFGPSGEPKKDGLYVLTVVLALVALTFPYVTRFGLLPKTWTVAKTRAARIILVLPLVALYVWLVVVKYFVSDAPDIGVGIAFAFGGAGAALAAQARSSELGPQASDKQAISTARLFAQILAFAIVLGSLGTLIYVLIKGDAPVRYAVIIALLILANGIVLAGPALGTIFKNTSAWRSLSVGLGIAYLVILYFAGNGGTGLIPQFESFKPASDLVQVPVSFGIGIGLFLFPAFAAVVSSPAFARGTIRNSDLEERLDLVAITMRVLTLIGAAFAVTHLAWGILVSDEIWGVVPDNFRAENIVAGVLGLAVVAVALAALKSFNKNPSASRPVIILALVLSLIIGAVIAALNPFGGKTVGQLLLMLAIPAIGAYALIGNKASRAFFEQSAARRPEPNPNAYQWTAPVRPVINASANNAAGGSLNTGRGANGSSVKAAGTHGTHSASSGATAATTASAYSSPTGASASTGAVPATDVSADSGSNTAEQGSQAPSSGDLGSDTGSVPNTAAFEPRSSAQTASPASGAVESSDETPTDAHSVVTEPALVSETGEDIPDESTVAKVSPREVSETQAIDRSELAALDAENHAQEAGHGYTYEQAKSPATPAIVLAKIAELAPELRPALAENPSTYPALVEWLGQLGDPQVDAALARRN